MTVSALVSLILFFFRRVLKLVSPKDIFVCSHFLDLFVVSVNIRFMGTSEVPEFGQNGNLQPINRSGSQIEADGMLRLDVQSSELLPGPGLARGFVWATLRNRETRTDQVIWRGSYKNAETIQFKPYKWKDVSRDIVVDGKGIDVITNVVVKKVHETGHIDLQLRFDMECKGERYEELTEFELLRLMETALFGGPHVDECFTDREAGERTTTTRFVRAQNGGRYPSVRRYERRAGSFSTPDSNSIAAVSPNDSDMDTDLWFGAELFVPPPLRRRDGGTAGTNDEE